MKKIIALLCLCINITNYGQYRLEKPVPVKKKSVAFEMLDKPFSWKAITPEDFLSEIKEKDVQFLGVDVLENGSKKPSIIKITILTKRGRGWAGSLYYDINYPHKLLRTDINYNPYTKHTTKDDSAITSIAQKIMLEFLKHKDLLIEKAHHENKKALESLKINEKRRILELNALQNLSPDEKTREITRLRELLSDIQKKINGLSEEYEKDLDSYNKQGFTFTEEYWKEMEADERTEMKRELQLLEENINTLSESTSGRVEFLGELFSPSTSPMHSPKRPVKETREKQEVKSLKEESDKPAAWEIKVWENEKKRAEEKKQLQEAKEKREQAKPVELKRYELLCNPRKEK